VSKRAVFLDRDGTLIEDRNYLKNPSQVTLLGNVAGALKRLADQDYTLLVISNQSGIARGYFTEQEVLAVNAEINRQLSRDGVFIARHYFCPHHPEGIVEPYAAVCDCRKPKVGLLVEAAGDYGIELSKSWFVGDKISDVLTGTAYGVKGILVKTGYGAEESLRCPSGVQIAENMAEAAEIILKNDPDEFYIRE